MSIGCSFLLRQVYTSLLAPIASSKLVEFPISTNFLASPLLFIPEHRPGKIDATGPHCRRLRDM